MRNLLIALALAWPGATLAEVPRVVADIPAVHALVSQVMGDLGQPSLLLDKGADEHDYQMRPSQAADLQRADLLVWIGPELTPWLDRAAADVSQLALLDAPGTLLRSYEEGAHERHDEGHHHDGIDPHAWLNPENARIWVALIAEDLAQRDPQNAAIYRENARDVQRRMAVLSVEIAALLAPHKGKEFITYHDAYGYFIDHFALTTHGAIAGGDAAAPGAARLSELRADMAAGDIICIFPDAQQDADTVHILAEGTPARIGAALDATGSASDPGPAFYDSLMRNLAISISDCLAD